MAADFDTYGLIVNGVLRFADSASIPDALGNVDWQQYQAWLSAGHTPRPLQPGPTYVWNGAAWVEDLSAANEANNQTLRQSLSTNDTDVVRSMRSVVTTMARLSPAFPPPAGTDRSYLLFSEEEAQNTRSRYKPPYGPTLDEAKALKIDQFRTQGLAYIQIGFIAQTWIWNTASLEQMVYITLAGYLPQGNLLTADGKLHIWDATGIERALTPLNATKLAAALLQWTYLAQREFWQKVAQVNASQSVYDVNAITWAPVYSVSNLFNADTYRPITTSGFDLGFDGGFK